MFKYFLELGANPNISNNKGFSVIYLLCKHYSLSDIVNIYPEIFATFPQTKQGMPTKNAIKQINSRLKIHQRIMWRLFYYLGKFSKFPVHTNYTYNCPLEVLIQSDCYIQQFYTFLINGYNMIPKFDFESIRKHSTTTYNYIRQASENNTSISLKALIHANLYIDVTPDCLVEEYYTSAFHDAIYSHSCMKLLLIYYKNFRSRLNISNQCFDMNTEETDKCQTVLESYLSFNFSTDIVKCLIELGANIYTTSHYTMRNIKAYPDTNIIAFYSRSVIEFTCTNAYGVSWFIDTYPDIVNTLEYGYNTHLKPLHDVHKILPRRIKRLIHKKVDEYNNKISEILSQYIGQDISKYTIPGYMFFLHPRK